MKTDNSENLRCVENIVGYSFHNPSLLMDALTRRSYWHENKESCGSHNERMEFLGDAVLGLIIAEMLYREFPSFEEGDLQKTRAKLVNKTSLANLSRQLGLGNFIRMGRGDEISGCRDRDSILADTLEAVTAAVFLDGGFSAAETCIEQLFRELMERRGSEQDEDDYKSALQERTQSCTGVTPIYQVVEEWGEEHCKMFSVAVHVGEDVAGLGTGKNKREAAQNAAKEALEKYFE
jgi:ribonuclease III